MFTGALLPYAQYVIYFTAGFLVLPTGRDFLLPGKPIMPGDPELIEAMNRDPIAKPCSAFMWRVFGFNFLTLSFIKYVVLFSGAMMTFYILFAVYGTVALGMMFYYKPQFEEEKCAETLAHSHATSSHRIACVSAGRAGPTSRHSLPCSPWRRPLGMPSSSRRPLSGLGARLGRRFASLDAIVILSL